MKTWGETLIGGEKKTGWSSITWFQEFQKHFFSLNLSKQTRYSASQMTLPSVNRRPVMWNALPGVRAEPQNLSSREPTEEKGFDMAKLNSGSPGCRAVALAGKYLSGLSLPGLTRGSGHRQRRMVAPRRRMMSSDGDVGKTPLLLHQQDSLGCLSAADRHAPTNRNLIYRDVRAFLSEVGGDPREARYWLTQFQRATATQSPAFAVLEVDWDFLEINLCFCHFWEYLTLFFLSYEVIFKG